MSHEWNRSFTPNPLCQITVPTLAQRQGDFSNTRDAANNQQTIIDPLTRSAANPNGTMFPGNQIPKERFNQYGPSVLNWLPLPNVFGQPSFNYQSQAANADPSFDQVYRADYNINDRWRLFVRGLDSKQTQTRPYGRADTGNNLGLTPFYAPTYGWSITANIATILSPTLTNEFQFGYTVNGIPGDPPPDRQPLLPLGVAYRRAPDRGRHAESNCHDQLRWHAVCQPQPGLELYRQRQQGVRRARV